VCSIALCNPFVSYYGDAILPPLGSVGVVAHYRW